MSDSGADNYETFEQEYVLYKNRPEWNDVTPIPQDDGEQAVVQIAYSEKFKDTYDYFRAVLQSGEKSERALELTKDALELNPANYTVWQYRREILFALNKNLWDELEYVKSVAMEYPKNYQIWHHRRVLVERLNDGSQELEFTALILKQEAKNYHAWQHRQWALKTFNLYEFELDYVNELLEDDLRNNSAWNQRYFVINNTTGFTPEVLQREVQYTLSKIEIAKDNESAWNYLRGLLLHEERLINNTTVTKFCEDLYKSGNKSVFLLALIVDMCDEFNSCGSDDKWYTLDLSLKICDELAEEHDTIREKYWRHIAENITKKREKSTETETDTDTQSKTE
ncbi:protein farnesyltransferase/geranylgeranyltransferase type-1 subunit alpha [Chrysoperla carnea]|uniref:protein farnesyltransferase/geranylgeranyltransferase type-1 subunit alpha n=1 Tax=Chrysoperla carnea TaxID=189513 RepID=UPI001D094C7C|nr:protein farnesyltransferase/geranylgeranyltransferase type-1 subunit alpha [Chrysoperla carnea]